MKLAAAPHPPPWDAVWGQGPREVQGHREFPGVAAEHPFLLLAPRGRTGDFFYC